MCAHMQAHVCAHTRGRGRKRKRRAIHLGMDSWAISQQFLFGVGVMPGPLKTSSKEPSSTFKFSASPIHLFLCIAVGEKPRRHKPALTPLFARSAKCSRAGLGNPQPETHPAGLPSPLFEQLVNADHETWCEQILAETDASRLTLEDRRTWQLLSYTVSSHSGINSSLPEYRCWRAQHQGQINIQCIVGK